MVAFYIANIENTSRAVAADDRLKVSVLEPCVSRIDDFDSNVFETGKVRVQTWCQDTVESTFDPDKCPLMIFQVDDCRMTIEDAAFDDHIQLFVNQPGVTLRDDIDFDFAPGVEEPVRALWQQTLDFTISEAQAKLVAADFCHFDHWDYLLSSRTGNGRLGRCQ